MLTVLAPPPFTSRRVTIGLCLLVYCAYCAIPISFLVSWLDLQIKFTCILKYYNLFVSLSVHSSCQVFYISLKHTLVLYPTFKATHVLPSLVHAHILWSSHAHYSINHPSTNISELSWHHIEVESIQLWYGVKYPYMYMLHVSIVKSLLKELHVNKAIMPY